MADRVNDFLDGKPVELRWYDKLFIVWNWRLLNVSRSAFLFPQQAQVPPFPPLLQALIGNAGSQAAPPLTEEGKEFFDNATR